MYKLKKQEGNARRGELETPHGTVQTPVFMNVGTAGYQLPTSRSSDARSSCQTHIIFISAQVTSWCEIWADCISL